MTADPIDAVIWRAKVLLDPNFEADGCLIAEEAGVTVGFLLSLRRKVPFFESGLEPDRGWITAFGVDPDHRRRGIGGALLDAALEQFDRLGILKVGVSPYVPNYFIPGPDLDAYASGIALLSSRGFVETSRPIGMRANLSDHQESEHIARKRTELAISGIEIRPAEPNDVVPLLEFVASNFSPDWRREATGNLHDLFVRNERHVGLVVARRGGEMLGYAQHRAERFGPFGVRADQRGNGIGGVILATTLAEMRDKGLRTAFFLWTDETAARLYERHGFSCFRSFVSLERES